MLTVYKSFCMIVFVCVVGFVCQTNICLSASEVEGKVNINTATEEQIAILPGIGPKLASEVIKYRNTIGKFGGIEDLKKVNGVGEKKLEKIRSFIVVEGETTIKSAKVAKSDKKQK